MERLLIGLAPHGVDDVTEWVSVDNARLTNDKDMGGLQVVGLDGKYAKDVEAVFMDEIEDMEVTDFVRVTHFMLWMAERMNVDMSCFRYGDGVLTFDPFNALDLEWWDDTVSLEANAETLKRWDEITVSNGGDYDEYLKMYVFHI